MSKRTIKDLRPYQLDLANVIKEKKKVLLAVDMGLGKTISTLKAIYDIKPKKVLIIAPLKVANLTWPNEIEDWDFTKDMSYSVVTGTEKNRLKQLAKNSQIDIINKESVVWLYEQKVDYDMIIVDESTCLKSAKTRTKTKSLTRYKAVELLCLNATYITLLTGTPAPNGIQDLYGQIKVLDNGQALGKSKTQFLMNYFNNISRSPTFPIWSIKKGAYEIIIDKLQHLMVKMKSEDYLELPDFVPIIKEYVMDDKLNKMYNNFKTDYIFEDIVASNSAILTNKLLQLSNGSIYLPDKTYKTFHTIKIDALQGLIDENPDENILVFYNYVFEKELLAKNIEGIEFFNDNTFEKWNNKEIKIYACNPASIGYGLNFQDGGNIMVWLSLPWSLELYEQSNKRLHRSGQDKPVIAYHLLLKDTVDSKVYEALKLKRKVQDYIFENIKGI